MTIFWKLSIPKAIDWFRLTELPTWKTKKVVVGKKGPKFYMLAPFVG